MEKPDREFAFAHYDALAGFTEPRGELRQFATLQAWRGHLLTWAAVELGLYNLLLQLNWELKASAMSTF